MKSFNMTNGFKALSDADLLLRSNSIVSSITGNAYFPTPTPTLASISSAITAFQTATEAAVGGGTQLISVRKAARQEVIDQLHLLSNYVLFTAAGNEVIATSSGISITKPSAARPPIEAPAGLEVKPGKNRGELEAKCGRVAGANSYLHEITPAPLTADSQWKSYPATAARYLHTGLVSGQEYVFRIAAIGPRDQLVYSGNV